MKQTKSDRKNIEDLLITDILHDERFVYNKFIIVILQLSVEQKKEKR